VTLFLYLNFSDQWRICLKWSDGNAYDVEVTDYHEENHMKNKKLSPIHPGEILMEEFLEPMGISQYRLAKDISVPPRRINEIVHGKRSITADTALRLGRFFGMSPQFWLNLQTRHDLEVTADLLEDRLDGEVHVLQMQTG